MLLAILLLKSSKFKLHYALHQILGTRKLIIAYNENIASFSLLLRHLELEQMAHKTITQLLAGSSQRGTARFKCKWLCKAHNGGIAEFRYKKRKVLTKENNEVRKISPNRNATITETLVILTMIALSLRSYEFF